MKAFLRLVWESTKWGLSRTPGPSMEAAINDKDKE